VIPLRDVIPSRTTPGVTVSIIALNVLVFFYQSSLSERGQEYFAFAYGLVPAFFSITAVFTSMFVHAGFAHIAGNMLFLWIFGDNVEDRVGHGRFILFYVICGFSAAVAQAALYPGSRVPMVGASGAIAGVMGGYMVLYPHSRILMLMPFPFILYELPALFFLGLWFLMQFLSGLGALAEVGAGDMSGGVAFWAHVVGFVVGFILIRIMRRPERQTVDWWDTTQVPRA
jgi:membrane associated rhomboid family serine protease